MNLHPGKKSRLIASAVLSIVITSAAYAQLPTRTESFDSGLGFFNSTSGNLDSGNSFDFSNSDNTLGSSGPGELGGVLARQGSWDYVADANFGGGTLLRTDTLTMSGELVITANNSANGTIGLGWFDTNTTGSTQTGRNFLGITIAEPGATTGGRFRLALSAINNAGTFSSGGQFLVTVGTPITFSLTYTGNANGGGVFNGTVGGSNISFNVPNSTGSVFNAFGFGTGFNSDNATQTATGFADNLSYTIPEPGSAVLLSLGALFLLRRSRSPRVS
jgi:hypothetical protein